MRYTNWTRNQIENLEQKARGLAPQTTTGSLGVLKVEAILRATCYSSSIRVCRVDAIGQYYTVSGSPFLWEEAGSHKSLLVLTVSATLPSSCTDNAGDPGALSPYRSKPRRELGAHQGNKDPAVEIAKDSVNELAENLVRVRSLLLLRFALSVVR